MYNSLYNCTLCIKLISNCLQLVDFKENGFAFNALLHGLVKILNIFTKETLSLRIFMGKSTIFQNKLFLSER